MRHSGSKRRGMVILGGGMLLALAVFGGSPSPVSSQVPADSLAGARINVFFDCEGRRCDAGARTFYRTELPWVNWVRDRTDSDIHLIMTSERTGSGGFQFRLDFIGREALVGMEDQLLYGSLSTDVEQEELDGLSTAIGVGIARYASLLGYYDFVEFEGLDVDEGDPQLRLLNAEDVEDRWNLWVFRVGGSGRLNGSETRVTKNLNGNLAASRTTLTWKVFFYGTMGLDHREIELNDSTTFVNQDTNWSFNSQVIYALADHWSAGIVTQSAKMTQANQTFRFEMTPSAEYSFFPYEDATRRALTARYTIGPAYRDYAERTVFGETEEVRWEQALRFRFSQRQQWGDGSVTLRGSHFLHDTEMFNVSLSGNVSFRIARGLNLNAGGNVSRVTDQIYLSAEGLTQEEILLALRNPQSDYNYRFNVGFSYQFGSIFNNVVNNRWPYVGPGG